MERLAITEMSPPEVLACTRTGCTFTTRQKITSYSKRTQDMLLHIQMDHHRSQEPGTNGSEDVRLAAKLDKPRVRMPCFEDQWRLFEAQWKIYRDACGLSGNAALYQLYNCMDEEVSVKIFQTTQGRVTDEGELLKILKKQVCDSKNSMVTRAQFYLMKQKNEENMSDWMARVRGSASLCNFSQGCDCNCDCECSSVSFEDQMVRDKMVAGLNNVDWQEKIMSQGAD